MDLLGIAIAVGVVYFFDLHNQQNALESNNSPTQEKIFSNQSDEKAVSNTIALSIETCKYEQECTLLRQNLRKSQKPEPTASDINICTIVFRFKNGEKLIRRFKLYEKVASLFKFVDTQSERTVEVEELNFVSHKKTFKKKNIMDLKLSLYEAQLCVQETVNVYDADHLLTKETADMYDSIQKDENELIEGNLKKLLHMGFPDNELLRYLRETDKETGQSSIQKKKKLFCHSLAMTNFYFF